MPCRALLLVKTPDADPDRFAELVARHRGEVDAVLVGGGDGTFNAAVQGLVPA